MKKITALLITALILLSISIPVFAEGEAVTAAALDLEADCAVLMHPSGKVIYEKSPNQRMSPASVTKIMTLLLIMEALDDGTITENDMVTASTHAASMGGSQVWLEEGETLSVHEMIKCIAVVSANDASVAMAEHLAGTEPAFVERMNQRAQELFMTNTTFMNCTGLPAEGHLTTAYDIALMSAALLEHPKIIDYTTIWHDSIRDGESVLDNTNKLLRQYEGVTGLKTGMTSESEFCISVSAERDGMELIAVVLHEPTSAQRNADVAAMLNYGFANFAAVTPHTDKPIMPVPVVLGDADYIVGELEDTGMLTVEKSKLAAVEKTITMPDTVDAPVAEGQKLGELELRSGDEIIAKIPIVAKNKVERKSFWGIFVNLLGLATMRD